MNVLETLFHLSILSYAIVTSYCLNDQDSNQEAAAYTFVILTFTILLLIILYHVYTHTTVFSKAMRGRIIDRLDPERPPPDDDIHQFNELLDMVDRPYVYKPLKQQEPVKPTQCVVEVHQPHDLAAPEVANTQHIP